MKNDRLRWTATRRGLAVLMALRLAVPPARGQEPPVPAPSLPPATAAPATNPSDRERTLEERLKQLEGRYEAMERRHAEEIEALSKKYEDLKKAGAAKADASSNADGGSSSNAEGGATASAKSSDRSTEGGAGARDNPAQTKRSGGKSTPTKTSFGPGFQMSTEDGEYQLQFHYLGQVDYRGYQQTNQDPVHSGFNFPRQRLYFTGRVTKPIEYYITLNRGAGSFDVLDAFINYHYDDRLMFKVGRYKTPFSYEFYAISGQDLMIPERSLFTNAFTPNRQLGAMAWGQLFAKRLDYAAGIFNGNRVSFQDNNEPKDIIAYLNARPFGREDGPDLLKAFNIGGSVDFGNEAGPPLPSVFRTSSSTSNSADATNIAPAYLALNRGVVDSGYRSLWGAHVAYFYKHLSLMAEYDGGYHTYATTDRPQRTKVPLSSYYVAMGYFLTGETLERRGPIKPLRPFDLRPGKFGTGAIELQGRYSELAIGDQIFNAGFADPNLWSGRTQLIDLGVTWYLTEYAKIYLEWEHAMFGNPVLYRPGAFQKTSDLFWVRFQVYF